MTIPWLKGMATLVKKEAVLLKLTHQKKTRVHLLAHQKLLTQPRQRHLKTFLVLQNSRELLKLGVTRRLQLLKLSTLMKH